MTYFVGWSLFLIFFKIYLGFKVTGRENVPKKGAFIIASNHESYFDPILLGTSLYRSLNYMARDTLFKKPLFGWVMRQVHSIPLSRSKGDIRAIKDSLTALDSGKPIVMFPEGTRSKDGILKESKPGIGFIIAKAGVPVVPAYIKGSYEALPEGLNTLKHSRVSVHIGEAVVFDKKFFESEGKDAYKKASDEIMRRIACLKEKYEGSAC